MNNLSASIRTDTLQPAPPPPRVHMHRPGARIDVTYKTRPYAQQVQLFGIVKSSQKLAASHQTTTYRTG